MNNQIEQIAKNVADEIKFENGVGIFSIAASARLVGVNESSIRRSAQNDGSMVKFLAQCGIDLRQLDIGKNGVPDYVHAMITKYYAYYAGRHCTELAKQADLVFSSIGVRQWIKSQLGVNDEPQDIADIAIAAGKEIKRQRKIIQQLQQQVEKSGEVNRNLLVVNGKQTKESQEYRKCVKLIKDNAEQLGLQLNSENLSDHINELAYNLLTFKDDVKNLIEDITTEEECYSTVSIAKWCFANNKQVPKGVKRWLSRYSKAVSEYCEIKYYIRGEMNNDIKYDNTEFHPKVIQFVKVQYDAGQKQQRMVETFGKLMSLDEIQTLEVLQA
jgi:hypothetical protein